MGFICGSRFEWPFSVLGIELPCTITHTHMYIYTIIYCTIHSKIEQFTPVTGSAGWLWTPGHCYEWQPRFDEIWSQGTTGGVLRYSTIPKPWLNTLVSCQKCVVMQLRSFSKEPITYLVVSRTCLFSIIGGRPQEASICLVCKKQKLPTSSGSSVIGSYKLQLPSALKGRKGCETGSPVLN